MIMNNAIVLYQDYFNSSEVLNQWGRWSTHRHGYFPLNGTARIVNDPFDDTNSVLTFTLTRSTIHSEIIHDSQSGYYQICAKLLNLREELLIRMQ